MEYLAWAREERGLSQADLSEICDISRQRISLIECGHIEVSDDEAKRIADALNYSVEDLI